MSEIHPVRERPDLPLEQRVQRLEIHLARLWDQVWWMHLSPEARAAYQAHGFSDPIEQFYLTDVGD